MQAPGESDAPIWVVRNKIDLDEGAPGSQQLAAGAGIAGSPVEFGISASRGDGVQELITALVAFAHDFFGAGEDGLIGRARQRKLLQDAASMLQRSMVVIGMGEELAAEELRGAAVALGRLLGRVDVEDVLDVIFREFCIGK